MTNNHKQLQLGAYSPCTMEHQSPKGLHVLSQRLKMLTMLVTLMIFGVGNMWGDDLCSYEFSNTGLSKTTDSATGTNCTVAWSSLGSTSTSSNCTVLNDVAYWKFTSNDAFVKITLTNDKFVAGDVLTIDAYMNSTSQGKGFYIRSTSGNKISATGTKAAQTFTYTLTSADINDDGSITLYRIDSNSYIHGISVSGTRSSTPTCAAPTFSPAAGTYTSAQSVTLSSTTSGATIYYTTDGSNPTTSSSTYSSAISVSTTTTIKAMAVKSGYTNSAVSSATYTIQAAEESVADWDQTYNNQTNGKKGFTDAPTLPATKGTKLTFQPNIRYSKYVINSRINNYCEGTSSSNVHGFGVFTDDGTQTTAPTNPKKNIHYVPGLVAEGILEAVDYYRSWDGTADIFDVKPWFYATQNWSINWGLSDDATNGKELDGLSSIKIYSLLRKFAINNTFADGAKNTNATTKTTANNRFSTALSALKTFNTNCVITSTTNAKAAGGWWHKDKYANEMWCDGQYMGTTTLAHIINDCSGYSKVASSGTDWDLITKQIDISWNYLWDSSAELLYHGFSAVPSSDSNWATVACSYDNTCSHNAAFWGRADGWYMLSLVDVLQQMDRAGIATTDANYTDIKTKLNTLAAGIAARQDATSGCWYQVLDQNTTSYTGNFLESSASALFLTAFMRAQRLGYISGYTNLIKNGYKGFVNNFLVGDGDGGINVINCSRSASLSDSADGTASYYLGTGDPAPATDYTEGKALGAFIMAAVEYERLYLEEPTATYTITYNANGKATAPATATEQSALPTTLPTPTDVATGYTFEGWYTDEGRTTAATAGAALTGDVTLYANYKINTPTVTPATGSTIEAGSTITVAVDGVTLTESYHLWSGSSSYTAAEIAANAKKVTTAATDGAISMAATSTTGDTRIISVYVTDGTFISDAVVCTYKVTAATVSVTGVTLNKTTTSITVGNTETLTATISPDDATTKTVTWTSDNTDVAIVADGVVTAVAEGTANITVTTTDGNKTATCVVTVTEASTPNTLYSYTTSSQDNIAGTYTATGGTFTVGNGEKYDSTYGIKLDGDSGSKYCQASLSTGYTFQVGDVITIQMAAGSASSGSDYGISIGTTKFTEIKTLYLPNGTAKNTLTNVTYTVTANDGIAGQSSIYLFRANGKSTYLNAINVTREGDFITISTQPQGGSSVQGTAATEMTVVATASNGNACSYQWQLSESEDGTYTDISGATSASYTVDNTVISSLWYHCVVSADDCDDVTTNNVQYSVVALSNDWAAGKDDTGYARGYVINNPSGTLSVTLGGWIFPNSVQDLSAYGTTSEPLGDKVEGSKTTSFDWPGTTTEATGTKKPDGYSYYIDFGTNNNPRNEYGSNSQPQSTANYNATITEQSVTCIDQMFNVPCSGSYLIFEPKTNGTVTATIYQNGAFDYDSKNGEVYRPQRRVFVVDEAGTLIQSTPKLEVTSGKFEKDHKDFTEYTWDLSSETLTEDIVKSHFGLSSFKSDDDNFTNGVYACNVSNDIVHNAAYDSSKDYTKGWTVLVAAPVTYTFDVKAGKTYYLYNFGSKLGFYGFKFTEASNTEDEVTTYTDTKDNTITATQENHLSKVSLNRTFVANQWNAAVLPFSMNKQQVDAVFGTTYCTGNEDGTQILYFEKVEGTTVYYTRHAYNTIVAGKPFLIKPTKTDAQITSENMGNFPYVTIENTTATAWGRDASTANYYWTSDYNVQTIEPYDYYIKTSGDDAGNLVMREVSNAKVQSFRGFLKNRNHTQSKLSVATSSIFDDEDEATIIKGIEMDENGNIYDVPTSGKIFNLNGQLVSENASKLYSLPSGFYIVNGKKYFVK